jgi:hypothetical protein
MLGPQESWGRHEFDLDARWDLPALVSVLSALLVASLRQKKPSKYQQSVLLQASACLANSPCASPSSLPGDPCSRPACNFS